MNKKTFTYFQGLDTLRFVAALGIIIHHIELLKGDLGVSNLWQSKVFMNFGPVCVTFFFVLSGFLITYFLLKERAESGSISILKFYSKRAFRIMPLYYLIVVLGLFILPNIPIFDQPFFSQRLNENFSIKAVYCLVSLPQVPYIVYPSQPIPYVVQMWAVGVETIFYIIWPIIVLKSTKLLRFLIIFSILFAISPIVIKIIAKFTLSQIDISIWLRSLDTMRLDCMAIGGIFAYILFFDIKKVLAIIYFLPFQFVTLVIFFLLLIFKFYAYTRFSHEIFSILFSIIILNVSTNPKSFLKYISKIAILDYFGKRSYGIYVYHMICIQIGLIIIKYFNREYIFDWFDNLLLYSIAIISSLFLASLSYKYFEKPIFNRNTNSGRASLSQIS